MMFVLFFSFSECGRAIPGILKGTKMMKLYVHESHDKFKGQCLFFVRARNDVPVNIKTMHEVFLSSFSLLPLLKKARSSNLRTLNFHSNLV